MVFATVVPIALMSDLNGGFSKLGFTRTTMQEEFKGKPDYTTDTLFMVHRQSVPEFKYI